MDAFVLNLKYDPSSGIVTGSNVKTNTPDTTLSSTSRNSTDSDGVARSPQPQHLAANLGTGSIAPFEGATATGAFAEARAIGATANGYHAKASVSRSTAVGNQAQALAHRAIAIGAFANAKHPKSTAIGPYAQTIRANQTVITGQEFWLGQRVIAAPAKSLVNNTTTEVFRIAQPALSAVAFEVSIGIAISDGTNTQSYAARAFVGSTHDAAGYTSTITTVGATSVLPTGTLAVTLSITQPATDLIAFNIKSNSSLTSPVTSCYLTLTVSGATTVVLV